MLEQGAGGVAQVLAEGSPIPVPSIVITAEPDTTSPSLVPTLASGGTIPGALLQGEAPEISQAVLEFSATGSIIAQAATPADAAARTAASSAALNLLQEAVQANPLTSPLASANAGLMFDNSQMLSLLPAVAGARLPNTDEAGFARTNVPPPPINGALPAAQPVMTATLVSHSPPETAMHVLLADTDGAIARQTLLQVASLPDQVDPSTGRIDPAAQRWNFEIPFVTPQGTAMAQFEISRDGGGTEAEAAKRAWRARFTLDVEPAGPVHALVSLNGDKTSVRMWAERPATADQLRSGVSQLGPGAQPRRIAARRHRDPRRRALAADLGAGRAFSGSGAMSEPAKRQLAVALHYDRTGAPRVVAKGKGSLGAKIIEVAREHGIPIEENEVLAGALSNVEIGDEIPAELYKAVAEVLIFVLRLSGRIR